MGFLPSGSEWIIILLIVLIVFGVGKLPQIGGAIGQSIREFREASKEDSKEPAAPAAAEAPTKDEQAS
jgi:sec-independent protein translocase protein TatA